MAKRDPVSRRYVLGTLGKAEAALVGSHFFFLTLQTHAEDKETGERRPDNENPNPARSRKAKTTQPSEKVIVSGSGSTLTFRVSGPPGRHCGVVYGTADRKDKYREIAKSRKMIGRSGSIMMSVDVGKLPNGKLYFRVVTSRVADLSKSKNCTEPFEVFINNGKISQFRGVKSRPLADNPAIAASFAASTGKSPR